MKQPMGQEFVAEQEEIEFEDLMSMIHVNNSHARILRCCVVLLATILVEFSFQKF